MPVHSICVCSWLSKSFLQSRKPDGPQTILHLKGYILSANANFKFSLGPIGKVKKTFMKHGLTWLDFENVAVAVFSPKNPFTKDSLHKVSKLLTDSDIGKILLSRKYKLQHFSSAESANSACLSVANDEF